MSSTVDTRVVEMQFDNDAFEKNIEQSLKSLKQLDKLLDNIDGADALTEMSKAADDLNFDEATKSGKQLSTVIDIATSSFGDLLQAGLKLRIVKNVIDGIENALKGLGKSAKTAFVDFGLGLGEQQAGMSKYEQMSRSINTMVSAGEKLGNVTDAMDKLNYYTDQTSFDFASMVSTIQKFTTAGVDLDLAEVAVEGIGNWGALSGAQKQQINNTMYNVAQAMSAGFMGRVDWKSVQIAGMDSTIFREQAIEAGVRQGTLIKKEINGVAKYYTATGKKIEVNTNNFVETLSKKWLDVNTMNDVFSTFADREKGVGKEAYNAAKAYVTWTDVIDTLKDTLSSGWMKSFEYIFGSVREEADSGFTSSVEFWTMIGDSIVGLMEPSIEFRNNILKVWHDNGGRENFIKGLENIFEILTKIQTLAGFGFAEIFKTAFEYDEDGNLSALGEQVKGVTDKFYEFTEAINEAIALRQQWIGTAKDVKQGPDGTDFWTRVTTGDKSEKKKALKQTKDYLKEVGVTQKKVQDQVLKDVQSGRANGLYIEEDVLGKDGKPTGKKKKKKANLKDFQNEDGSYRYIEHKGWTKEQNDQYNQALQIMHMSQKARGTFYESLFGDPKNIKDINDAINDLHTNATEFLDENAEYTSAQSSLAQNLQRIFAGTAAVASVLIKIVGAVGKAFATVLGPAIAPVVNIIIDIVAALGDIAVSLDAVIGDGSQIAEILAPIGESLGYILEIVEAFVRVGLDSITKPIKEFFTSDKYTQKLTEWRNQFSETIGKVRDFFGELRKLVGLWASGGRGKAKFAEELEKFVEKYPFVKTISKAIKGLLGVLTSIASIISKIVVGVAALAGGALVLAVTGIIKLFNALGVPQKVVAGINWLNDKLGVLATTINNAFSKAKTFISDLKTIIDLRGKKDSSAEDMDKYNQAVSRFLQKYPFIVKIIDFIKQAKTKIGELADTISQKLAPIKTFFKEIKNLWDLFKGTGTPEGLTKFQDALSAFRDKYPAFDFLMKVGENLKSRLDPVFTNLKNQFTELKEKFKSGELQTEIKEWISSITEGFNSNPIVMNMKKFFEPFKTLFSDLKTWLYQILTGEDKGMDFGDIWSRFFGSVKENLFKGLENFDLSKIFEGFDISKIFGGKNPFEGLNLLGEGGIFSSAVDFFKQIGEALLKLPVEGFESLKKTITDGLSGLGDFINSLTGPLYEGLSKIDIDKVKNIVGIISDILIGLNGAALLGNASALSRSMSMAFEGRGLFGPRGAISKVLRNFAKGGGIKGIVEAFNTQTIATKKIDTLGTTILKIAASITLLAVSIVAISAAMIMLNNAFTDEATGELDIGRLWGMIGAITAIGGIMVALMYVAKLLIGGPEIVGVGAAFVFVAASILMIIGAIKILANIDAAEYRQGLLNLIPLLIELGVFLKMVKLGNVVSGGGKDALLELVGLAILIGTFVAAIWFLGNMKPSVLVKGIIALTFVVIELTAFVSLATMAMKTGKDQKSGSILTLIGLAIMIRMFVKAISILGKMDTGALIQGIIGLTILLVEVQTFLIVARVTTGKGGFASLGSLLAIVTGIAALAYAVKILGEMKFTEMLKGIFGMKLVLKALGEFMKSANGFRMAKGSGLPALIVIAGTIAAVTLALQFLVDLDPLRMLAGIVGLSIVFVALGGFMKLASGFKMRKTSGIMALLLVIGLITTVVIALRSVANSNISTGTIIAFTGGLGIIFGSLAALMLVISNFKVSPTSIGASIGAFVALIATIAILLTSMKVAMNIGIDFDQLIKFSESIAIIAGVIAALALVMGILSLIPGGGLGGALGLAAIIGIVGLIGVFANAVGEWDKDGTLSANLERAKTVAGLVGDVINAFVTHLLGVTSLKQMATDLNEFATSITGEDGFLAILGANKDNAEAARTAAEALMGIAGAMLGGEIAGIISNLYSTEVDDGEGGTEKLTGYDAFITEMTNLAPKINDLNSALSECDTSNISKCADGFKALGPIALALTEGTVLKAISDWAAGGDQGTSKTGWSSFLADLEEVAPKVATVLEMDAWKKISKTKNIQNCTSAFNALASIALALTGGEVLSAISAAFNGSGEGTGWGQFVDDLKVVAPKVGELNDNMPDLSKNNIEQATGAFTSLTGLAAAITGGALLSNISTWMSKRGNEDGNPGGFGLFATDMAVVATKIVEIDTALKPINGLTFAGYTTVFDSLSTFAVDVFGGAILDSFSKVINPETSEGAEAEKRKGGLAGFATDMATVATKIAEIDTSLSGINTINFQDYSTVFDSLSQFAWDLLGGNILDKFASWVNPGEDEKDPSGLVKFANDMATIATKINEIDTTLKPLKNSTTDFADYATIFSSLGDLSNALNSNIFTLIEDVDKADTLQGRLTALAGVVNEFGAALNYENIEQAAMGASALNDLMTAINSLRSLGDDGFGIGSNKEQQLNTGIERVITALTDPTNLQRITTAATSIASAMGTGISTGLTGEGFATSVAGAITTVTTAITNSFPQSNFKSCGTNIQAGLAAGLKDTTGLAKVVSAAQSLADACKKAFNERVEIESPSRVFKESGRFIDEGLAAGINDYSSVATDATGSMADSVIGSASSIFAGVSSALAGNINDAPSIRPVVDMSDVMASSKTINGLMSRSYGMSIDTSMSGSRARAIGDLYSRFGSAGVTNNNQSYNDSTNFNVESMTLANDMDIDDLRRMIISAGSIKRRGRGR